MDIFYISGTKITDNFPNMPTIFFNGINEEYANLITAENWQECAKFFNINVAEKKKNNLLSLFPDYNWTVTCVEINDIDNIINNVYSEWESICDKWIKIFCEKQQLKFDGWIGDEIGGIASFCRNTSIYCSYSFNFLDIILDITTKQTPKFILDWYENYTDNAINKRKTISYWAYTKGANFNEK